MSNDLTLVRNAFKALKDGNVHSALEGLQRFFDTRPPDEPTVDWATRVLQKDYQEDVDSVANDLADSWRKGEYDGDRDSFYTAIDEAVESTRHVIYTLQAQLGLAASGNDGAMFDETGEDTIDCKNGVEWSKLMFWAMRADVMEELNRLDIDVNEDPPLEGSSKCKECEEYKPCKEELCEECRPEDPESDDSLGAEVPEP